MSLDEELERMLAAAADGALGEVTPPRIDLAAAAAGLLDVAYATVDSPVGRLLVAATPRGLVRLAYLDDAEAEERALADLAARVSPRILSAPARVDGPRRELDDYFAGRLTRFETPVDWALTHGFTQRVLRATARIPFGAVSTYKQVATAAGSPRGHRAAGNALGTNPIPIVVPCHRVLHSGGGLGGYTGGVDRKRKLLAVERYDANLGAF
jgi:methylated-DNA-[protein]-cysteine S-methyltransferase